MKTQSNSDAAEIDPTTTCSRLEVEVVEHKRQYITIEVSHDKAKIICRNLLEYSPTLERIKEAEDLIIKKLEATDRPFVETRVVQEYQ